MPQFTPAQKEPQFKCVGIRNVAENGLVDTTLWVKNTKKNWYMGAEGQRKITVEEGNSTENWKAVRGFWDGSKKTDGRAGCGVVIKGVDRDKWITIRKIAVLLKACTDMAAEVVGASVLTGILDLVLGKPSVWTT